MLANVSIDPWTVALFVPTLLCAYWVFDSLILTIKLRKSSGVRSNVLASDPFTGMSQYHTAPTERGLAIFLIGHLEKEDTQRNHQDAYSRVLDVTLFVNDAY